jgi:hypothetical protein
VKRYYQQAEVPVTFAAVAANVDGTASADEHLPHQAIGSPRTPRTELVAPVTGSPVTGTATQSSGTEYIVDLVADGAGPTEEAGLAGRRAEAAGRSMPIDLKVFYFPGWTAKTLSGPGEVTLGPSHVGLIQLTAPQAGSYKVALSFGTTPVRTAASALSLLMLLLLFPALKLLSKLPFLTPQPAPALVESPPAEPHAAA